MSVHPASNDDNLTTAYLALGSNLGDRAANLRAALNSLREHGLSVTARSKIYCTQSVEGGGPEAFLNAALRIETDLEPLQVLAVLRSVEAELGRPDTEAGRHRGGSRTIDIDLLFYGAVKLDTPELELPHPRMHRRAFVLKPLLDVLEGGWVSETEEDWS